MRKTLVSIIACLLLSASLAHAEDAKKLKAVMYVGGCCHDRSRLNLKLRAESFGVMEV